MTSPQVWLPPPDALSLGADEAHIWRICLDRSPAPVRALEALLSADERERAQRFRFARDRSRFVVGRGLLRTLLGRYLRRKPDELRFSYGPHGKPALRGESSLDTLSFNLAHSDDLALLAVARRPVGVDLERVRADLAGDGVVTQIFTAREQETLRTADEARRLDLFFRYWTRKEAYLKAHGAGFSLDPRQIDVSASSGEPPSLVIAAAASRWCVRDLYPEEGYAAALAVEGTHSCITRWQAP